jgi:hypothetical protein
MSREGKDEQVIIRERSKTQKIMESPEEFNEFLKGLLGNVQKKDRFIGSMEQQFLAEITKTMTFLRKSEKINDVSVVYFENLKLLTQVREEFKNAAFNELNKDQYKEKAGVLLTHLLSHGVISREDIEEKFQKPGPSVTMAILVDRLMTSKSGTASISPQVAEIKKLAESDPGARAVLFSSLMSLGYATNRLVQDKDGKLLSLILSEDREDALKWDHNEIDTLLSHMGKFVEKDNPSKNLYSWSLVEMVEDHRNRLLQDKGLVGANITATSTTSTVDFAGNRKRAAVDVAKEFLGGLVGFGVKSDMHGSRWAAVTDNPFSGSPVGFGDLMMGLAAKFDMVRLSPDRKITDINWSRVLNLFVLADYGLQGLELGIKKVGSFFGDHTTARSVFQAPFVAILRIPRLVLEGLGRATSVGGVPDRYGDAEKGEKNSLQNYKEKMRTFNFDKQANTQWAIENFMYTHRKDGAYSNVKTSYDEQITQILLSRKNNSDNTKLSAIEVMALRNTLVEYEGKRIKTSADRIVIESVQQKLEKALTELKAEVAKDPAVREGGQTMTDTVQSESRNEASE